MRIFILALFLFISSISKSQISIDTIILSKTELCSGELANAVVMVDPSGNYTFQWTFAGNIVSPNNDSTSFSSTQSGNQNLIIEVNDGLGNTDIDTVVISVFSLPIFNVTASDDNPNCTDTSILSVNFPLPGNYWSNFTVHDGNNSNTSFPAPFANLYSNAKQQYLFRASELIGMGMTEGNITKLHFPVTQINGLTTYPDYTIKMGSTSVASFTNFFLPTHPVPFYGPINTTVQAGNNQLILSNPFYWDGIQNIVIEICYTWVAQFSYTQNSVTPYINTSFNSSIANMSDFDPICNETIGPSTYQNRPNFRFYMQPTTDTNNNSYAFVWQSNVTLNDSLSQEIVITPTSSNWYYVTVSDSLCSSKDSLFISYDESILINDHSVSSNLCMGDSIQFNLDVDGGGQSVEWTFDGGNINTSTDFNPIVSYSQIGNFDYSFIIHNTCNDSILYFNSIDIIDPELDITVLVQDDTMCTGTTYFGNVIITQYSSNYIWTYFNAGNPIIVNNHVFINPITTIGNDSIHLSVEHSVCHTIKDTTLYFLMEPCVGIFESETEETSIHFTQNPESITISSDKTMMDELQLFDRTGRLIENKNESTLSFELSIAELKFGLYFIRILSDNNNVSYKFFIP